MIEPEFKPLKSIKEQIQFKKVVFYDNNLLMNPHIEDILQELAELRADRKIVWCESQSGFDGRLLLRKPRVASMLKRAGFRNPRIAWDHGEADHSAIHEQLQILRAAGYDLYKETFIFMVYNWETPFKAMEAKRIRCWKWGVQIADCRFRPLDQLYDRYRGSAFQGPQDYYIHTSGGWTDALVKQFRRNVREQNICVRHGFSFYSRRLERKGRQASGGRVMPVGRQIRTLARDGADCWVPRRVRFPLARATASRK